ATIETDTPGNYTVNVAGKEYMVVVNDGSTMGSVNIGVLAAGDAYKANVTFSGSKKYNGAFKESTFDVKKAVNPVNFYVSDETILPEKVTISISNAVAGEYVVSFNDYSIKNVVLTVDGNSVSCDVAVPAGSYNATLSWRNENYFDVVKEANFVVYNEITPKENVSMSVTADAITEGENALVIVKLPVDAGGRVTINGITVLVENGTASVLIPDLPVGNNEINVAYSGDDKYNTLEMNVIVTVNEIHKYDVAMNISEGENNTILVSLPKDAVGMITAYVGDKEYIAGVVNGTATITFNDLENGNYVFSITYLGDNKYDSITKKIAIVVDNYDEVISAPNVVKYYRGTERFVVNVTDNKGNPLVNKSVNIGINGMNYSRLTNAKGSASIALGLPSGKYNVTVIIDKASINSLVTILPTVNGSDVIKVFRNDTQYYATFRDSKGDYLSEGTTVRFNISGVFYDRQVKENGLARLNINLESGSYIITAMNLQTGEMSSNNITVISRLIENKDITKYYRNATQYTVKLIGGDGNPVGAGESVIFNINGVFYTRQTNESGIAKLNLNLEPGNYIITAEYKECRVSNNIHIRSVLSANDLTKVYRGSEQFIANLID
ncbi:MAG: Ig-like domain repeat protein, partial [Methanobrevibacter sp.]|uniref:Ig-like domain-containing protein n=1 Tax=Methanobrevibacter sp. TaxID=66852 RepID=UPI001B23BBCA